MMEEMSVAVQGGESVKIKEDTFTWSGTSDISISDVGFKPKKLLLFTDPAETSVTLSNGKYRTILYDEDVYPDYALECDAGSNAGSNYLGYKAIPNTSGQYNHLKSIDSNGFTVAGSNAAWAKPWHYIAIG